LYSKEGALVGCELYCRDGGLFNCGGLFDCAGGLRGCAGGGGLLNCDELGGSGFGGSGLRGCAGGGLLNCDEVGGSGFGGSGLHACGGGKLLVAGRD
jgi:hypothetical protein